LGDDVSGGDNLESFQFGVESPGQSNLFGASPAEGEAPFMQSPKDNDLSESNTPTSKKLPAGKKKKKVIG
jgi:hypothetical protein